MSEMSNAGDQAEAAAPAADQSAATAETISTTEDGFDAADVTPEVGEPSVGSDTETSNPADDGFDPTPVEVPAPDGHEPGAGTIDTTSAIDDGFGPTADDIGSKLPTDIAAKVGQLGAVQHDAGVRFSNSDGPVSRPPDTPPVLPPESNSGPAKVKSLY